VNFGIITADSSEEIQKTATDAGANFVIRKPFTADKFNEALATLS
jgi:CheY-like chemotaxis protein